MKKWGEVPVIFLSGCTDYQEIRRTMNLGADDFLTKPVQLRDILEAVNARLGLHRKKQQREESRLAAAASVFAGIIHDLENSPTPAEAAGDTAARASQILEQVRQRLYPAKDSTPAPAVFWPRRVTGRAWSNYPRSGCSRPAANIPRHIGGRTSTCLSANL